MYAVQNRITRTLAVIYSIIVVLLNFYMIMVLAALDMQDKSRVD